MCIHCKMMITIKFINTYIILHKYQFFLCVSLEHIRITLLVNFNYLVLY